MQVDIRHARLVVVLADTGSISKAAAKLGLPQPSVSAQLRRIEKAMGGELFVRSRSGITPTPLGERLIPMLADLALRADEVIAEASLSAPGRVRVGAAQWTPVSLGRVLQDALPRFEVVTETVDAAVAVQDVARGRLGAALVPSVEPAPVVPSQESVVVRIVLREPVLVMVPADHPFAGYAELAPADLSALRWVRYARGHWFHPVDAQLLDRVGVGASEVLHHVSSQDEARTWVSRAGAAALAAPSGPADGTVLVPAAGLPHNRMALVWRRGGMSADAVETILVALRRHYCELARESPRYWEWLYTHSDEVPELKPFLDTGQ